MNMLIEVYFTDNGIEYPLGQRGTYPNCGGYDSADSAVKELKKRFPHRQPVPYKTGLDMDNGNDTRVRVWFE